MKLVDPLATLVYENMKLSLHFCRFILPKEYFVQGEVFYLWVGEQGMRGTGWRVMIILVFNVRSLDWRMSHRNFF